MVVSVSKVLAIVLAVCLGLMSLTGQAAPPLQVAVDTDNPPFMYGRQGHAKGLYPDIVQNIFARTGTKVLIVPLPWPRALASVNAGKMGIAGIYKTSSRMKVMDFSDPLFVERIWVYSLSKSPHRFRNMSDLSGLRVGVIRGWSYGDEFDAARKQKAFTISEIDSDELGMSMLRASRIDVMLSIQQSAQLVLGGSQDIIASSKPLAEFPTYVAFPKSLKMTYLLARFNKALADAKQDGSYSAIAAHAMAEAR